MSKIPNDVQKAFNDMLNNFDGLDVKYTDEDSINHELYANITNADSYSDFKNKIESEFEKVDYSDMYDSVEYTKQTDFGQIIVEFLDDNRLGITVDWSYLADQMKDDSSEEVSECADLFENESYAPVPKEGDRVRLDHYMRVDNGITGTVTGKIGELCWVTWDDGTKSKEIKGFLTVIGKNDVNESYTSAKTLGAKAQDIANYLEEFMNDSYFIDNRYFDDETTESIQNSFDALSDFAVAYRNGALNESGSSDAQQCDNLGICPNCGSNKFNDKIGLCVDCGYDEKSNGDTGTDDYFDESLNESSDYELARPNSVKLMSYIDRGLINPKNTLSSLIDYLSDNEVGEFLDYIVGEYDLDESINESMSDEEFKNQLIDDLTKQFFSREEAVKLTDKDINWAENLAYGNATPEDFIEAEEWLANN